MAIGFDFGDRDLICAKREGNGIRYRKISNVFSKYTLDDPDYLKLKTTASSVETDEFGYVLGQGDRRTIIDGRFNTNEPDAFMILQTMCTCLVGKIKYRENLYFSVPEGVSEDEIQVYANCFAPCKGVTTFSTSRAMSLVYAELGDKQFTGISIVVDDVVNVCYSIHAKKMRGFSCPSINDIDNILLTINLDNPVDIVIGGRGAPAGIFRRPVDYIYAAARGCLVAAEMSQV